MSQGEAAKQPQGANQAGQPAPPPPAEEPSTGISRARFSDPQEVAVQEYRAVSGLAVSGLLLGLLSVTALFTRLLWIVPAAGIAVSAVALRRIAEEAPALIGRKAALVGLILSVGFAVAAPTDWVVHRWLLRREARQFAMFWFDVLRQGAPHKAHQLTLHPGSRQPLEGKLWDHYTNDWRNYREIRGYVGGPLIRTLLALNGKAEVRYYDTERQWEGDDGDALRQVYAVTFEENGKKKTFFVGMTLERIPLRKSGRSDWRVTNADGGIKPADRTAVATVH